MPSFSMVMRGYTRREVDELFARIDATLGRGPATSHPVTAADVRATQFGTSLRGYDRREVDEALNAVVQELEQESN